MRKKTKAQGKKTNLQNVLIDTQRQLKRLQTLNSKTVKESNNHSRTLNSKTVNSVAKNRVRMTSNCRNYLISKLTSHIPLFREENVTTLPNVATSKGMFGEIHVSKIDFMNADCVKKIIRGSFCDVKAEALVMLHVSGHPCFPVFYGLCEPGALLMEFIPSMEGLMLPAKTLKSVIGKSLLKQKNWYQFCRDLINGLSFLHKQGILHNDLHGNNVLIRPRNNSPCIIYWLWKSHTCRTSIAL